jgi:hypothetical protein
LFVRTANEEPILLIKISGSTLRGLSIKNFAGSAKNILLTKKGVSLSYRFGLTIV